MTSTMKATATIYDRLGGADAVRHLAHLSRRSGKCGH